MKLFEIIKRLLNKQQSIFFIMVIILIVPNCFLFFTEPLSAVTRIAYLAIPLGFYLIWSILSSKPGWMIFLSLPFFILGAFQLVLLYLFGNSIIAVDMFTNLVTTNAGEAGELLGSIWPAVVGVCILYIPLLILGVISVRNNNKLSRTFRVRILKSSFFLFLIGGAASLYSSIANPLYEIKHVIFPLNVVYNIKYAAERWHMSNAYHTTSKDFKFRSKRTKNTTKREVYLLIIGETSRAFNWQLNGYPKETNPLLSKREDILFYSDAITQSNTTHKSVPLILGAANANSYEDLYKTKSVITAFKEAGFKTLYISNQALNRSLIDFYAAEADQRIDLSPVNNDLYKENLPDGNALSIIQDAINEDNRDLFIVFHSYGSHFNYQHRYPKEMASFKPDNASTINHKNRQNIENAYDNSIRYTDYVLNSAINVLNDSTLCSGMLYLSDHGEDLMDDDRRKFLHASPIPTYYQLHIPVVLWLSENYIRTNPVKRNAAIDNHHKPVSTSATFNTITDMAGISTILSDKSYSLLNPDFEVRERLYVNDHNEPCPFFNLGLDQKDLNLIDSMKIYYDHSLYKKPVY